MIDVLHAYGLRVYAPSLGRMGEVVGYAFADGGRAQVLLDGDPPDEPKWFAGEDLEYAEHLRTHSWHPWGIPADEEILKLAGVRSVEFDIDDEGYIRGKVEFKEGENPEVMLKRLAADGWRYDENEGAWIK